MSSFSKKLKELRENFGITQLELSQELKVQRTKIGKWENENTEPNFKDLIKIADYFNVSTDYLLGREPEQKQNFSTKEILKKII